MEPRYREPSDSMKLVMILIAVPLLALAAIPMWAWHLARLAAFRIRNVLLRRER
jgi:hypothetical protein